MLEVIGWIGAVCFAVCAAPQAWLSYKQGHAKGLSWATLILWLVGEICALVYTLPTGLAPLIFNYAGNLLLLAVIIRYRAWPRITH